MSTLAERLKEARAEAGLTQEQLAKLSGLSTQSMIASIESGVRMASTRLPQIAAVLGVSSIWLAEGRGQKRREEAEIIDLSTHPDLAPVRRVHIELSAGIDGYHIEMAEEEGDPIFFRRDWLREKGFKAERLVAVRVKGSSMEPNLWAGDLVVINQDDTKPKDGKVFAVNYEGEPVIKRMRRDAGQWLLASDNADQARYAPKHCNEAVTIIGRVVYKQSEEI